MQQFLMIIAESFISLFALLICTSLLLATNALFLPLGMAKKLYAWLPRWAQVHVLGMLNREANGVIAIQQSPVQAYGWLVASWIAGFGILKAALALHMDWAAYIFAASFVASMIDLYILTQRAWRIFNLHVFALANLKGEQ